MTKNPTRKNNRLKGYDYAAAGWYFVTICARDKVNIFGDMENENTVGAGLASARNKNNIKLSKLGHIVDDQWQNIQNQYDNITLDTYVVMPNHIHGILIVDHSLSSRADARPAPTVSDIICSFKSKCTVEYIKYIQQNNLNISGKIWQRSFHDRIIRNEDSLNAIRTYISHNPENWEHDVDNLVNI